MAKAKKLPSGSWRVQVYLGKDKDGKSIYRSVTADTKKEAEFLAAEVRFKHKQKVTDLTLTEAIDKYCESKSNILSPSTIRGYRTIQRNRLQSLMQLKLSKIDLTKFQQAINADAVNLSEKTLRNSVGLVKTILAVYMPDTRFDVSLPQKRKYEPVMLSLSQLQIFLKALQGDKYEFAILSAAWLTLRASEICGLTWSDYDPDKKTLRVRSALVMDENGEYVVSGTKTTESDRTLNLSPYLCHLLDELPRTSERIIPVRPSTIRKRVQKICSENNLPIIRLHDLRHCSASIMLLLGIPQKYAMERGGWSTSQTMEKIYQHTFTDEKNAADEKINDFFNGLIFGENV